MPCPACLVGWVAIVPDGTRFGYRLAYKIGCKQIGSEVSCNSAEIAWWHLWRMGELPPLAPPGARERRYVKAELRNLVAELPEQPTLDELHTAAYRAGSMAEAAGMPGRDVAHAIMVAARRSGLAPEEIAQDLATSFSAGRARPYRIPSHVQ